MNGEIDHSLALVKSNFTFLNQENGQPQHNASLTTPHVAAHFPFYSL
jgi:hypothetical protein